VTSRARQRDQAAARVAGHGPSWPSSSTPATAGRCPGRAARRPQHWLLADPDRGWDAIVIGEYERAFYDSQYALMAPLFEHYGVQPRSRKSLFAV